MGNGNEKFGRGDRVVLKGYHWPCMLVDSCIYGEATVIWLDDSSHLQVATINVHLLEAAKDNE